MSKLLSFVTAIGFSTLPSGEVKLRSGSSIAVRTASLIKHVQNTNIVFVELEQPMALGDAIALVKEGFGAEKFAVHYTQDQLDSAIEVALGLKKGTKAKSTKTESTHDMIKVGSVFVNIGDKLVCTDDSGTDVVGTLTAIVDGTLHIKVEDVDGVQILTKTPEQCSFEEDIAEALAE